MPRIVKYLAVGLGSLLVLLLIAIAIISATFDPNAYKPQIIKLVQEKKQRTLTIPGTIKLTFFPKLGADLGKVSLSEKNNPAVFASIESARISLALLPLLKKQGVIDQIKIDGLTANIKRYKDGSTNFDDLLAKNEETSSQDIKLDIDGISIKDSNIVFDDRMAGRKLELAKVNLKTGRIADGKPGSFDLAADIRNDNPQLAAQLAIKSGFILDLEKKHYVLNDLDTEIKGQVMGFSALQIKVEGNADLQPAIGQIVLRDVKVSGGGKQGEATMQVQLAVPAFSVTDKRVKADKITGQAKLSDTARNIEASFSVPSFDGTPQAFTVPALGVDALIKQGDLEAKVKLAGTINGNLDKLLFTSPQIKLDLDGKQGATVLRGGLATPVRANMQSQTIELPEINADFTLPNPAGGSLVLKAGGNVDVNLAKQTLAAQLHGKLDQSAINAKIGLTKFSPPAYVFDVVVDQIDVDRYSKKTRIAGENKAAAEKKTVDAEQPIDLSALKDLNANGTLKIGSFKAANIKASNVRLDIRAAQGRVEVSPLAANLYQGSLSGSLSIVAMNPPRFAARQNLSGVNIGPFLKDAIGKDPIEGRGSVQLDVTTQGALVSALKKGLNGTARVDLKDGAVRGINIAKAIRTTKAKAGNAGEQQAGTSSPEDKTDFSELGGTFHIVNGVAHNEDFSAKSPLLRIAGQGDINLGNDSLEYLVKATIVSTLQGQGGAELQALKGLTVPVKLYGPFTAIGWRIDLAGLAKDAAKQKVEEKKQEIVTKAKEQLQDRLKGLFGR